MFQRFTRLRWTYLCRSLVFDRPGFPLMDVRQRRAIDGFRFGGLASHFNPSLDFGEIPHNATARQLEALRKLTALLHIVDGDVCERNNLP